MSLRAFEESAAIPRCVIALLCHCEEHEVRRGNPLQYNISRSHFWSSSHLKSALRSVMWGPPQHYVIASFRRKRGNPPLCHCVIVSLRGARSATRQSPTIQHISQSFLVILAFKERFALCDVGTPATLCHCELSKKARQSHVVSLRGMK